MLIGRLRREPRALIARALAVAAGLVLLTGYHLLLRLTPRRVLGRARRTPGVDRVRVSGSRRDEGCVRAVLSAVDRAADLHPCKPQCLERALASRRLLRWMGVPAVLVLGVRRNGSGVEAHAWVDIDSRSLDARGRDFTPLTFLP